MHEILGNRFVGNKSPGWHMLGTVHQEPISAEDAFRSMGGLEYHTLPLYTPINSFPMDWQGVVPPEGPVIDRALWRAPVPEEPSWLYCGAVGKEYVLLQPIDVCKLWDKFVKRPIETMAVLWHGQLLFMSAVMPSVDIAGERIHVYMVFTSPYVGGRSYKIMITMIRPVCWNTLVAGESVSTHNWKIAHDATAPLKLAQWFEHIPGVMERKADMMADAFRRFAGVPISEAGIEYVLSETYPFVNEPDQFTPRNIAERQVAQGAVINMRRLGLRQAARTLFDGRMKGADALGMNFWRLFNAIVELEDCRPGKGEKGLEARAADQLLGVRADVKRRAFDSIERWIDRQI